MFIGVNGSQAADAGLIILPPLGAALFAAAGRHPLAGLACAFAGVAGGFGANVLPSTLDVLLAGFTQEAVKGSGLLPGYQVQILGNYFFMFAACPLLTICGTLVTDHIVEPRLGPWTGGAQALVPLTQIERRGLRAAGLAVLIGVPVMALLVWPGLGPLQIEGPTQMARLKPLFDSMVPIVMLVFFIPGLAYGLAVGRVRTDHDVVRISREAVGTMAGYIVMAFCCAQFVSYIAWSKLGAIVAISGAQTLRSIGLEGAGTPPGGSGGRTCFAAGRSCGQPLLARPCQDVSAAGSVDLAAEARRAPFLARRGRAPHLPRPCRMA